MHLFYSSRATPRSAFFEGMVRVFDWWALFLSLRRKSRRILAENDNPDRNQRVIERYVRDSIADFEVEETDKLSDVAFIPRRIFVVADIVLGPLPTEEVIIHYEGIVPGAVDRIMRRASERLKYDSETELRHLRILCRQGLRGMVAGFILTLLLTVSALVLVYFGLLWAGILLVAINFALGAASTLYVSKAGLRRRWFTGEFFPRIFHTDNMYRLDKSENRRRPAI